jgi:hypothetical protein
MGFAGHVVHADYSYAPGGFKGGLDPLAPLGK